MIAGMLSGCGDTGTGGTAPQGSEATSIAGTAESGADQSGDTAVVSYYTVVDAEFPEAAKEVQGALNEYMKEKIGVTVDYHWYGWADYGDKISTKLSAGEEMDLFFANDVGLTYANAVGLGALQPIEELLPVNAPNTWNDLPDFIWDAATINGHIYGVPIYKDCAYVPGIVYNKTMAEDLGVSPPAGPLKNQNDVIDWLYEVKEKRDAKYPEDQNIPISGGIAPDRFYEVETFAPCANANIAGIESFAGMGKGEKVFNLVETPEYLKYCQLIRQLVQDGIMPLDTDNYDKDNVVHNSGKQFCSPATGYVSIPKNLWGDNFDVELIPLTEGYLTTNYITYGVISVAASSKQPENCVKVLEMLNSDNYVATTIRFGTEEGGYHIKNADGTIKFEGTKNADPQQRAYHYWYGWVFGNIFAMSLPETESPTLWEDIQKANEQAFTSENLGFTYDSRNVTNELAACTAVRTEYESQMTKGMQDGLDVLQQQYVEKLKVSGVDRIIEDCQKQLSEWRASKGLKVAE